MTVAMELEMTVAMELEMTVAILIGTPETGR